MSREQLASENAELRRRIEILEQGVAQMRNMMSKQFVLLKGKELCPETALILSAVTCQKAAGELGFADAEVQYIARQEFPRGCFVWEARAAQEKLLHFNSDSIGGMNTDAAPICLSSSHSADSRDHQNVAD